MKYLTHTALERNADARLRYLAAQIHPLGPRPLFELFREVEAGSDLLQTLERFAKLEPLAELISHLGGDRLPPPARLAVTNLQIEPVAYALLGSPKQAACFADILDLVRS